MRNRTLFILLMVTTYGFAQPAFYDLAAGSGNGIRFWGGNDGFKISMGNTAEYQYGPVSSFSIRSTMDNVTGRGWSWGLAGSTTNVASLNVSGQMQIAGSFKAKNLSIGAPNYDYLGSADLGSIEFPRGELVFATTHTQNQLYLMANAYYTTSGFLYRNTAPVAGLGFDGGNAYFWSAPTGSAGALVPMNSSLTISNDGKVGVGTTAPSSPLHVKGSGQASHLTIETDSEGDLQWFQGGVAAGNQRSAFQLNAASGDFEGWVYGNTWQKWLFVNRTSGFVGIGTNAPDAKLSVSGQIHATEVKVTTTVPGPDYVFEKSYALPTLDQVKSYIDQNKHLPEVPSAKEMETNGVKLGEMNMLLLKKVEELTLYILEQEKRIKALEGSRKNN